jgi:hypothetical protein
LAAGACDVAGGAAGQGEQGSGRAELCRANVRSRASLFSFLSHARLSPRGAGNLECVCPSQTEWTPRPRHARTPLVSQDLAWVLLWLLGFASDHQPPLSSLKSHPEKVGFSQIPFPQSKRIGTPLRENHKTRRVFILPVKPKVCLLRLPP